MNERACRRLVRERSLTWAHYSAASRADGMRPVCEWCGRAELQEHHHRKNRSQGGLWEPQNMIGLCRDCHHLVTVNPKAAREQGLTVRSGQDPGEVPLRLWHCESLVLLDDVGGYRAVDGGA